MQTLDDCHPLRIRAAVCPNVGTRKYKKHNRKSARPEIQMSRAQRAYRQLPEAEAAEPLAPPFYQSRPGSKVRPRKDQVEACKLWITNVPKSEICAYSDGASEGKGRSAWGFVLKLDGKTFQKGSGIKHGGEALDAEIMGAKEALKAALGHLRGKEYLAKGTTQCINVLMDSRHAINALSTGRSSTSHEEVRKFRELSGLAQVRIKWVAGHSGIHGNEEADAAAKSALRTLPSVETEPATTTTAILHQKLHRQRQTLLDSWWNETCPSRYRELDLLMRRRKPPELGLSRLQLRHLIAARTGHGNFAAHHRRFNNPHAITECTCGEETTPTHFIHCRLNANITRRIRGSLLHNAFLHKLLGPKCFESFRQFAQDTNCFGYSPVHPSPTLSGDRI